MNGVVAYEESADHRIISIAEGASDGSSIRPYRLKLQIVDAFFIFIELRDSHIGHGMAA